MSARDPISDEDLLASSDSEAFGAFYDRHVRSLLGYFGRRTGDPEVAADLTAETFACAIAAQDRYRASGAPALAWLYTIAGRRLADYQRRGAVERRMRRSLAIERPRLTAEDAATIALLAEDAAGALLAELPPGQRDAVSAHVIDDRGYPELAKALDTSQDVVRQRVSRGLATLRRHLGSGAVSDFITELRREVVDAHSRHRSRGPVRRASRRLHPALAQGANALALALVAAALVVAGARIAAPDPAPVNSLRVTTIAVGGAPLDGVLHARSLWIVDSTGTVARVDLRTRRVIARIRISGQPESIGAGPGGLWVRAGDPRGVGTHLYRIDPERNRITTEVSLGGGGGVVVGPETLWAPRRHSTHERIDRIDPATGEQTGTTPLPNVSEVAAQGRTLWALTNNGTLARIDGVSGRIVRRWPALGRYQSTLTPDGDGVWVLSMVNAELVRVTAGGAVRRFPVAAPAAPLVARGRDGLWIVTGSDPRRRYRLTRIDPETGGVTATVDLGRHHPTALVPDGRDLWALTSDGQAVLVTSRPRPK